MSRQIKKLDQPIWPFAINRDSPQSQGLYAWWPLGVCGGSESDIEMVRGLTMTHAGSPPSEAADGGFRCARSFNGSSQYLTYGAQMLSDSAPFSITAWIRPATLGGTRCIAARLAPSQSNMQGGLRANSSNGITFAVANTNAVSAVSTLEIGKWSHGCGIYIASGDKRSFIDGGNRGRTTLTTAPSSSRFAIGARHTNTPSEWFTGLIRDVRVYNRALSDEEVGAYFTDPRLSLDLYYELGRRKWFLPEAALQLILPNGIATGEAFGATKLNLWLTPSAIASAEALGTAKLNLALSPSAIASAEAVGTAKLNLQVAPSAIASVEAVGTAQLNLQVSPSAIASAEAIGTAKLNLQMTVSAIASAEQFGSPTVILLLQFITPSGVASAEAFGTASLRFTLTPSAIGSGEAFGTPQLNFRLFVNSIASAEALGSPGVLPTQFVVCTGIASAEAIGSPALGFRILPTGISSAEALGTASVINRQIIVVSGIATGEAVSQPAVGSIGYIVCSSIASAEAVGAAQLNFRLFPTAILPAEAVGSPQLNFRVSPPGVASAEGFGTPHLNFVLHVTGLASAEAFGAARVTQGSIIVVSGIASQEAFGSPTVALLLGVITPGSISSGETFGIPSLFVEFFAVFLCVENLTALSSGVVAVAVLDSGADAVAALPSGVVALAALGSGVEAVSTLNSGTVAVQAGCSDEC